MNIIRSSRILAAIAALYVGTCVLASGAVITREDKGVLAVLYNPGAAPPRWNTLAGPPHATPRPAICFYSLRRLRPIGYLSVPDAIAGIAPIDNNLLIAENRATPAAKRGTLAGRHTTITEYDPTHGRIVARRKYDWLMGPMLRGRQASFITGPDGIVWVERFQMLNGKSTFWLSSLNWPTGRMLGSSQRNGNNAFPFIFAVKGAALLIHERGRSATATVVRANGTAFTLHFPKSFRGVPYHMASHGRRLDGMSMTGGYFISIKLGRTRAVVRERKLGVIHGRPVRGYAELDSATGVVLTRDFGGNACDLIFVSTPTGRVLKRVTVDFPGNDVVAFGGRIFLVSPGGRVARCGENGRVERVGPPAFGPLLPLTPTAALGGSSPQKGG